MQQQVLDFKEKVVERRYAAYGRVYRVEGLTGLDGVRFWRVVGRGHGFGAHVLWKLGSRGSRVEMQGALDRWAQRYGHREVRA